LLSIKVKTRGMGRYGCSLTQLQPYSYCRIEKTEQTE